MSLRGGAASAAPEAGARGGRLGGPAQLPGRRGPHPPGPGRQAPPRPALHARVPAAGSERGFRRGAARHGAMGEAAERARVEAEGPARTARRRGRDSVPRPGPERCVAAAARPSSRPAPQRRPTPGPLGTPFPGTAGSRLRTRDCARAHLGLIAARRLGGSPDLQPQFLLCETGIIRTPSYLPGLPISTEGWETAARIGGRGGGRGWNPFAQEGDDARKDQKRSRGTLGTQAWSLACPLPAHRSPHKFLPDSPARPAIPPVGPPVFGISKDELFAHTKHSLNSPLCQAPTP